MAPGGCPLAVKGRPLKVTVGFVYCGTSPIGTGGRRPSRWARSRSKRREFLLGLGDFALSTDSPPLAGGQSAR